MSGDAKTILVRGWRSIPHSYAIVNEFQCLELLRRPGVKLYFEDLPYFRKKWQPTTLFTPEQERAIRSIPPPPADLVADAELRIAFPYDLLSPPRGRRLFVFGTAEFNSVPADFIAGNVPLAEAHARAADAVIVTPSNWSREGFVRSGADPARVVVVPHGVDPALFRPPASPAERADVRRQMNLAEEDFVFYTLGTMSGNKGIDLLLRAFAAVLKQRPSARLLLKGLDAVYSSLQFLQQNAATLPAEELKAIEPRLIYTGQSLSFAQMPRLYHAADCYVSPYFGEGFNLPVLEAAACGVPVICTAGGPTDDFTTADFARRIASTLTDSPGPHGPNARALFPSVDDLARLMLSAIDDGDFRRRAAAAGPAHVRARFTWTHAVDRLLAVMLT